MESKLSQPDDTPFRVLAQRSVAKSKRISKSAILRRHTESCESARGTILAFVAAYFELMPSVVILRNGELSFQNRFPIPGTNEVETKAIDHRRIIRTLCDIVSVGAGAICLFGAFWFTDVSGHQIAVLLLLVCGAVAGILVGCTENRNARQLAVVVTAAMSFFHLYIQYVVWQRGLMNDVAEPVALTAVPVIMLVVAQSIDWFSRRACVRIEDAKKKKGWMSPAQPIWRLVGAFLAAYRWLAFGLLLMWEPAGAKASTLSFVIGCLIQLGLAVVHTAVLWFVTNKTESVSTRHAGQKKSSVPHVAKPSL